MADLPNHPHVIPNVDEDIMRRNHISAIDSTHKVLQLLCVNVEDGNGYLQEYHSRMTCVKLELFDLASDGRTNNPPPLNFPSHWREKDYLESALAENIYSFCLRVGRDPQELERRFC